MAGGGHWGYEGALEWLTMSDMRLDYKMRRGQSWPHVEASKGELDL